MDTKKIDTKKIDSLSEAQVSQLAIYQEKWLSIGLSIEPTDIPAAEAAVRLCYKLDGLIAPQSIICADSPLNAIAVNNQIANQVRFRDQVYDHVYDRVMNQVWSQVSNKIQILDQVWNQVSVQVCNQVYDQVWNQVSVQVCNQVYDQVYNQVYNQIDNQIDKQFKKCYGCHEAGSLSFYDYFREVCGLVEETEKLTGLIAIAKCCGWWTPYKDVVIIQHRPCFINFDDEKRLHCDDGMAIKYRDGFGVWAINGIGVDEQIVMKPKEQTVAQISEEKNVEVKRVRIERFGWNRYLTEIGAKVIDSRHNEIENTYETLVRTPDGMTILLPTCKTGRLFSLEVPSDVSTCEQAQNWLHSGSQLDEIVKQTRVIGRS